MNFNIKSTWRFLTHIMLSHLSVSYPVLSFISIKLNRLPSGWFEKDGCLAEMSDKNQPEIFKAIQ